jgi:hypothetical protein
MLVIAKRSILFREPVAVVVVGDVATPVKKPWEVRLTVGMSPQEAPDFLAEEPAFKHAVQAGVIVILNTKSSGALCGDKR